MADEVEKVQPIDTVAMQKLIAKVKKGDADNAAEIEAETAARAEADANLKDYVDSNVLRIAPPEYAGDGEVIFYRGHLLQ